MPAVPKLLEWERNGLTFTSKGFAPAVKSVSHPPIRSVRFVQAEPRARVAKQIESAMDKNASVHLSEAFQGKYIAVRRSHLPGQITLLFRQFRIGRIDRERRVFTTKRIYRLVGDPRENV